MATVNPFDLLGDDDNDDPSQLIAAQQQKIIASKAKTQPPAVPSPAKIPSKHLPPSQAVREAKSNTAAPRGRGRGRRGGGTGQSHNFGDENDNGFARNGGGGGAEDGDGGRPSRGPYGGPRQAFRGGRDGGFGNLEVGGDMDRPRRTFERRSGTGRGYEMKRDGAGRGNWGSATDDAFAQESEGNANIDEKSVSPEKQPDQEVATVTETDKENKEGQTTEPEEKEKENKEMTLEEYEKIREEKRKAVLVLKTEERKVEFDKELKSMQQLSLKKENDAIYIKLGSDKEKKKESSDRDEKAKMSLSIDEFLKPTEGERYYSPGGRGRGRGRWHGDGGSSGGGFGSGANTTLVSAPSIEDTDQFPTLGGK